MTEPLDTKEFQLAVADAIKGVINVYREADAVLRELRGHLGSAFVPLAPRVTPAVRRQDPDGRYLQGWIATVFAPHPAATPDHDDEDDEEDDDDEDEDGKVSTKQRYVDAGAPLIVARISIHGMGLGTDLPKLTIYRLERCNVTPDPVAAGTPIRVTRPRGFRRLIRAIDANRQGATLLETTMKVYADDKPKAARLLTVEALAAPLSLPFLANHAAATRSDRQGAPPGLIMARTRWRPRPSCPGR